jgi:hypothetical protein
MATSVEDQIAALHAELDRAYIVIGELSRRPTLEEYNQMLPGKPEDRMRAWFGPEYDRLMRLKATDPVVNQVINTLRHKPTADEAMRTMALALRIMAESNQRLIDENAQWSSPVERYKYRSIPLQSFPPKDTSSQETARRLREAYCGGLRQAPTTREEFNFALVRPEGDKIPRPSAEALKAIQDAAASTVVFDTMRQCDNPFKVEYDDNREPVAVFVAADYGDDGEQAIAPHGFE